MRTFKDLLRFHNNLDFEPFLEALGSIRDSYTGLGTDIFKDAVPLPGVSMKYLLPKMCPRVLAYDANALYPSTMEVVAQWAQTPRSDEKFIKVLQRDRWFGFA
ncbi:unnamed protein product, partial [Porites lobata]